MDLIANGCIRDKVEHMRFVVTGEWTKNSLLRLIILFFLVYVVFFWMTNLLLYCHKMDFTYQGVVDYYLGSAERFTQPRSYQGLLEVSHFHLFSMGILMLTVTHLLLFIPLRSGMKAWLVCLCFGSAFLDEASSWLVRFVHPLFAYLKIGSFVVLQLTLLIVVLMTAYGLITRQPSAYKDTAETRKSQ